VTGKSIEIRVQLFEIFCSQIHTHSSTHTKRTRSHPFLPCWR